jgi:hypothetical protein
MRVAKHGSFSPRDACGFEPNTKIDVAYSHALTDHYFPVSVLDEIAASIRSGRPHPTLPPDQEAKFRETWKPFLRLQVKRRAKMGKGSAESHENGGPSAAVPSSREVALYAAFVFTLPSAIMLSF